MAHKPPKHSKKKRKQQSNSTLKPEQITQLKQWGMVIVSVAQIVLFFSAPLYRMWLSGRIIPYFEKIPAQAKSMDVEQRLIDRHGYDYIIPRFIHQNLPKDGVLLLPPPSYVKRTYKVGNFRWHHIVWNYYFFGKQSLIHFKNAKPTSLASVTHAMICDKNNVRMAPVETPGQLQQILASYIAKNQSPKIALSE